MTCATCVVVGTNPSDWWGLVMVDSMKGSNLSMIPLDQNRHVPGFNDRIVDTKMVFCSPACCKEWIRRMQEKMDKSPEKS